MTLNERYRVHNKLKSDKLLLIYILFLFIFIISTSFARFVTESNTTLGLEIANWCIKINDTQITQETSTIMNDIELITTENISEDGFIKPGQSGYFDIILDPQYTEVSLKYKILIDVSELPSQIKLTDYSINDFSIKQQFPGNNILEGNILLNGSSNLDDTDKKIYRIYWQWPEEDAKIEDIQSTYKVKANIQVEQIIK